MYSQCLNEKGGKLNKKVSSMLNCMDKYIRISSIQNQVQGGNSIELTPYGLLVNSFVSTNDS